jgi:ribosomal protein L40E
MAMQIKGSLYYKRMRREHLEEMRAQGCRNCGSRNRLQLTNRDPLRAIKSTEDGLLAEVQKSYFLCRHCAAS